VEWFRGEIATFKDSLKDHFGVFISDDRLWKAIKIHNETRRLQRQLYELRKKKAPPITGAEVLAVMVAGTAMPREEYNKLLKELVDELSHAEGHSDYRARLMLIGGILDDPLCRGHRRPGWAGGHRLTVLRHQDYVEGRGREGRRPVTALADSTSPSAPPAPGCSATSPEDLPSSRT